MVRGRKRSLDPKSEVVRISPRVKEGLYRVKSKLGMPMRYTESYPSNDHDG